MCTHTFSVTWIDGFENGAAPPGVRRGHAKLDDALSELRRVDFRAAQGRTGDTTGH
jgi:hypothetical protein